MSTLTIKKLLPLLFATMAIGCSPLAKDGQPTTAKTQLVLRAGQTIGQTFQARDNGLNGVEVFLSPEVQGNGTVRLHLRNDATSTSEIDIASIAIQQVTVPAFYRFVFSPRDDSFKHAYYFFLEVDGNGSIRVDTASGETYLDGAFYQDGDAVDAQATFRLTYEPTRLILGLLHQGLVWLVITAIAIFLYVLPGLALLKLCWQNSIKLTWSEKLGLAIGISVALYPLLLLWVHLVGLQLGAFYAWLPAIASLLFLIWHHRKHRYASLTNSLREWRRSDAFLPDLMLVFLIVIVIFSRFWVIRTLDVPMWGDSYQHTMIAQLIVDNGGLFDSWLPYVPYNTLTVQFGFPANVALFSWVTNTDSASSTLMVGQLLNAAAILALYPLSVYLAGSNRWAGVGAVLVAGLLSPMPSFYVNWGRYAQLAGQVILPISLWLVCKIAENKYHDWRMFALAGGVLAGMILTYYRMPFYYATFILAWLLAQGFSTWKLDLRSWLSNLGSLAMVGIVALVLFLPWGIHIRRGNLQGAVEYGIINSTPLDRVLADYQSWLDITTYVPQVLLIVVLAGLVWSVVRKHWMLATLGLWAVGLASLVAGQLIRLPGANLMQNFAVLIALYIPVGLLGGYVISQIMIWAEHKNLIASWIIVGAIFFIAVALGVTNQMFVQNPQTFALVTPPDVKAMSWIRKNTSTNAQFLSEGFSIYNGLSAVGADAGWWIPLLAKRSNTMPPQYALFNEMPVESDYSQRVVELVLNLEKRSPLSSEGVRLLCNSGITHVFIGQRQGKVGVGVRQLYSQEMFASNNRFIPVYHQDRVFIYTFNRLACASN